MLHSMVQPQAPYVLAQSGIPMIVPSSGTIGNNGALSGITALHTTYAHAYMYFPAGAIYAGSAAGLYYVRMTNTTTGTIYNNTYSSGVPVIPTTPTAFVCVGPGAYVQVLTEITLQTITVPGGSIGANGCLRVIPSFMMTNNANTKTPAVRLGGVNIFSTGITTYAATQVCAIIQNRGVQNSQVSWPNGNVTSFGAWASVGTWYSVDTAVNQSLTITGRLNTAASDFITLERYTVEIMRG